MQKCFYCENFFGPLLRPSDLKQFQSCQWQCPPFCHVKNYWSIPRSNSNSDRTLALPFQRYTTGHWLTLPRRNQTCHQYFCSQKMLKITEMLPDITGRTALAVRPDAVNAKYHVITNATYNRDHVPAKFKHVTNIDTCTLLCCDYSTLWEALHVNMVEIGARCSDKNVKILGRYQWIGWKRRTKMVGE